MGVRELFSGNSKWIFYSRYNNFWLTKTSWYFLRSGPTFIPTIAADINWNEKQNFDQTGWQLYDIYAINFNGMRCCTKPAVNNSASNVILCSYITGVLLHPSVYMHYSDVIMSTMASQITSLAIVYSTVYWGAGQRKHQNSASLAFVTEIHRLRVNSPHKGPVTRKMLSFDDVIMECNYFPCLKRNAGLASIS